ncbi:hypothetical protein AB2B41_23540, partial [Marimonas sp. MJW-29]
PRPLPPATHRRCATASPGNQPHQAATPAVEALNKAGNITPTPRPASYTETDTTTRHAARKLNPRRTAQVHVGTRKGPHGPETFKLVER